MVIVQAGHQGIQQNCYPDLRGGTGAPGEIDWTPGITAWVVATLNQLGVPARAVDANFNCDPHVADDYDAFVAIHYQSDPPAESGYWVGVGDPTQDGNAAGSASLRKQISDWYENQTGLTVRPAWDSINIQHYYLFEVLASKTPYALIECGTGAPGAPDHDFLWSTAGKDKVGRGILNGILTFMGKPAYAPTPTSTTTPPADPCADLKGQLAAAIAERDQAKLALASWHTWFLGAPK